MGTTAEKGAYLNQTKLLLKDKINALGGSIDDETTFREYANQLDGIYGALPKTEFEEGTEITLSNTIKGKLDYDNGVVGIGQTEQDSTQGYQLLSINANSFNTQTQSNVEIKNNGDGSITFNGVANNSVGLRVTNITNSLADKTGTFTFSKNESGILTQGYVSVVVYGKETSSSNAEQLLSTSDETKTFTTSKYYAELYAWIWFPTGTTSTNYTIKPMLETGSTAHNWEQYTGGQASPNPSYPQEIEWVRGKNIYDKSKVYRPVATQQNVNNDFENLEQGELYTFSTGNHTWATVLTYDSANNRIRTLGNTATSKEVQFTPTSQEVKFITSFYVGGSVETKDVDFTGVQLEKGSATPYLPYNTIEVVVSGKNIFDFAKLKNGNPGMNYPDRASITFGEDSFRIDVTTVGDNFTNTGMTVTNQVIQEYQRKFLYEVKPNTTYTFIFNTEHSEAAGLSSYYCLANKDFRVTNYDNTYANFITIDSTHRRFYRTFTTKSDTKYVAFRYGDQSSVSVTYSKIMLVEGEYTSSNLPDYEPYITPKTYQLSLGDIELNAIGNYKDTIRRSSGKNLLPWGTITGNATTEYTFNPALEAGSYSFSFNAYNPNGGKALDFLNANNTSIKNVYMPQHTTKTHQFVTFTVAEPISKIRIYSGSAVDEVSEIMLVKGEYTQVTMPDYEPYGVGVWYKYGKIGEKIFTGASDETWTLQSINQYGIANFLNTSIDYKTDVGDTIGLCNYFEKQYSVIANTQKSGFLLNNQAYCYIRIESTIASTVEAFKTWLQTHNTQVIYVKATPTIDIITGTLAEQLEEWWNGQTFNGTTIITSNGDLPLVLKVRALKGA